MQSNPMKVEIFHSTFADAVRRVFPFAGTSATLPVLNNIMLSAANGRIILSATDLEGRVDLLVGAKVESPGSITVPARALRDWLTAVAYHTGDDFKLALNVDGHSQLLTVTADFEGVKVSATFKGIDSEEYPMLYADDAPQTTVALPAGVFGRVIQQIYFVASREAFRPNLTGVHMVIGEDRVTAEATDTYVLARMEKRVDLPGAKAELLIPATTAGKIAQAVGDRPVELRVLTNGALSVRCEDERYTVHLIDMPFPDTTPITQSNARAESALVPIAELKRTYRTMRSVSAHQSTRPVKVEYGDDIITTTAQLLYTTGTYEQEVAAGKGVVDAHDVTGAAAYALDTNLLMRVLAAIGEDGDVKLVYRGPSQGVVLSPPKGEIEFYVMPLGIKR
jgi:DNA polymerase III subunit beta